MNVHMYGYMFLFLLTKARAELLGLTFLNFNFLRNCQLFCKVAESPPDVLDPGCLMWFTKAFQSSCTLPFHLYLQPLGSFQLNLYTLIMPNLAIQKISLSHLGFCKHCFPCLDYSPPGLCPRVIGPQASVFCDTCPQEPQQD